MRPKAVKLLIPVAVQNPHVTGHCSLMKFVHCKVIFPIFRKVAITEGLLHRLSRVGHSDIPVLGLTTSAHVAAVAPLHRPQVRGHWTVIVV